MKTKPVSRWILSICLLWLSSVSLLALGASEVKLVVRTPLLAPDVTFSAQTKAWLERKSSIRVAFWGGARPPLHMGFEPDRFVGVTADVLGLLQQTLGVRIQMLRYANRAQALQAMARDEVDVLAFNDVAEPGNSVFSSSIPYLLNHKVIIRRTREAHKPNADLRGQRLAYIDAAGSHIQRIQSQYPQSTPVPYTNYLNALADLAYGQVDAFRTNAVTAEFLLSSYRRNDLYIVNDVAAPDVADINFAINAREPLLLEAINQSLMATPLAEMLRITSTWTLNSTFVIARKFLELTPEQTAWIKQHPTLKVVVAEAYAPLTFYDDKNRLNGLSVDLLKSIERLTGLQFEVVRSDSISDMVEKLQGRKVDLIAAISPGDFRLKPNQYTRPYLASPLVLVTRRADANIRGLHELNGLRLALPWGSPLSRQFQSEFPRITQLQAQNATQGLEMLAAGQVDGSVHSQFGAEYFINQHFHTDLRIASVIGSRPNKVAMAVSPDNQVLKSIIDAAMLDISPDEFRAMIDRWGIHEPAAVASSWSTYKDVVYTVIGSAILFVLMFLIWNHYLRLQIRKRKESEQALEEQITEREHLLEQLRLAKEAAMDASRSKSMFLASMSHEIRTPVSALVGLIELLRIKGGSGDHIEESLELAHQSTQSLLSLIGDVLDISKIEAGEMKPSPRPTHVGEMVQSIYRLFEPNAQKKNLEYRLVTEVQHNGIMIDALMLNQIVSNLLSNAIKFTEQGSIQLLLRELPGESEPGRARFAIQVSDTGRGLSESQREEIFEPFVQADAQAHRAVGTGLGLSICTSLAKLLNAQLSVDSQVGLGSRFTLVFEADLVEIKQGPVVPVVESQSEHKLRILVVEDHAPNRLLLCRQLEYLGHEAFPCDDGEAAFAQWLRAEPPFDLTITDCNMPRMDGYALSQAMREVEQQRAIRMHPVFGLTANAQAEITEQCLAAGMTRCLYKPVSIETLASLVSEVAKTSKRRALAAAATGSELDKIRLLSPESYAPLVKEMVLAHRQDSKELERLAREDDRNGLVRISHKIRGGAQLAGDAALTRACRALEQLVCEENEALQYRPHVEHVLVCLQSLETRLLLNVETQCRR